ncbi:chromosome segregation protein [Thalassobacillus devorans]|uniref:Chromosome segregation protein n=1 Tax=Thalassobacillus devorans TaxID=279813 RepID=A0ABQ1NLJ6_9BACI|nr:hypothetical protein [Thalassobacillus devorans]NIK27528.1 hypothetical protein [Thalassobacillus devorans]GGC78378.1 chromosome segregation protein [Thalassobacillus devorans]
MNASDFLNMYVWVTAAGVLAFVVLGLIIYHYFSAKSYKKMVAEVEREAVTTLDQVEKDYELKKEEDRKKVKEDYEQKIAAVNAYVKDMEKLSRTASEMEIYTIVSDLKDKLVNEGSIQPSDMILLPNVYLPLSGEDKDRKFVKNDLIVLMKSGIYLLGTNNLEGKVLYGMNQDKAKEVSFLLDDFFSTDDKKEEKTLVADNAQAEQHSLKVRSIEDPATQVLDGMETIHNQLQSNDLERRVLPIVYFTHSNQVINYSKAYKPYVFDQKEKLAKFLVGQLKDGYPFYTEKDMKKLKAVLEHADMTRREAGHFGQELAVEHT